MFKYNLSISIRRLVRHKLSSAMHITGLTLGMTVCLSIGLFLKYELSFDNYHEKADRTYRINSARTDAGNIRYNYATHIPLAEALRTEITGLENIVRAHPHQNATVEITPAKRFIQDRVLVTEPSFLDIFHVELLRGSGKDALAQPYQALITESTANKFFGKEDPIGKTFLYKNKFTITVAGLISDFPSNTHLPASMLLSYVADENYLGIRPDRWSHMNGTSTFVVLPENYSAVQLQSSLKTVADKYINKDPIKAKQVRTDFELQPLRDIHFEAKYGGGGIWVAAIDTKWLWFFGGIGLMVLLLACINFVNLSTAQSFSRATEVGVRKAVGAGRFHLINEFLYEAWLLALLSGILSILIVKFSLPVVNKIVNKGIEFDLLLSPGLMISLLIGIVLIGLLSGIYPAWVIARFNTVATLKTGAKLSGDHRSNWLRKTLVVTQFTISAGMLIAVLFIAQQVNYMRYKDLGFDKENIVNVPIKNSGKAPLFATALSSMAQVADFSFATATPSSTQHWGTQLSIPGITPKNVTTIMADNRYCNLYDLKLLAGRYPAAGDTNYLSASLSKEKQVIRVAVNETLVKAMGYQSNEHALGKTFWCGVNDGNAEIIGVLADFNTNSLHSVIEPTLITPFPQRYGEAGIKIRQGADLKQALTAIEVAWKKAFPDGVFQFKFLDEQIDAFYKEETRLYSLFRIFSILTILISCIGLWGLAALAAKQRTKEIGIRKVFGASVTNIIVLLTSDFLKLVAVALVIASPLAWYFINRWLQDFPYRINITLWVFAIAGIVALLIALLTISFQAIKSALANPVKSLRTD